MGEYLVQNYQNKIYLGTNKYAYEQLPEYYDGGVEIVDRVLKNWKPPNYYFHYQKGGHLAALRAHEKNFHFTKLDLSRFFYKVTKNKIIRSLVKIGVPFTEANDIATVSVVRADNKFILPYGFVQSSLLSSVALRNSGIGKALHEAPKGISVSVYVDDILISTKGSIDSLRQYSEKVCLAAAQSSFPINIDKSEIAKENITIFNIDLSTNHKAINDERLAGFLMDVKSTTINARAAAMINYVSQVNKKSR